MASPFRHLLACLVDDKLLLSVYMDSTTTGNCYDLFMPFLGAAVPRLAFSFKQNTIELKMKSRSIDLYTETIYWALRKLREEG